MTLRNCFTNLLTLLQIGLVVRDKSIIEVLHHYGVTWTYDEMLRFKSSTAHAAARSIEQLGLSQCDAGIQVIEDNFDATISSPNGLQSTGQSTHALATLVTQPIQTQDDFQDNIKRLYKTETSYDPDIPVSTNEGPEKPSMPDHCVIRSPLSLRKNFTEQGIKYGFPIY